MLKISFLLHIRTIYWWTWHNGYGWRETSDQKTTYKKPKNQNRWTNTLSTNKQLTIQTLPQYNITVHIDQNHMCLTQNFKTNIYQQSSIQTKPNHEKKKYCRDHLLVNTKSPATSFSFHLIFFRNVPKSIFTINKSDRVFTF